VVSKAAKINNSSAKYQTSTTGNGVAGVKEQKAWRKHGRKLNNISAYHRAQPSISLKGGESITAKRQRW